MKYGRSEVIPVCAVVMSKRDDDVLKEGEKMRAREFGGGRDPDSKDFGSGLVVGSRQGFVLRVALGLLL